MGATVNNESIQQQQNHHLRTDSIYWYLNAVLWSPIGKELTSWLSFVMSNCDVATFPIGILGQVWCLIVSIPDICPLYYLNLSKQCRPWWNAALFYTSFWVFTVCQSTRSWVSSLQRVKKHFWCKISLLCSLCDRSGASKQANVHVYKLVKIS